MADVVIPSTSTLGTQMLDWAYFQQASSFTGDATVLPYSGANMRVPIDFAYTSEGVRTAPSATTGDFAVTPGSNTATAGTIQIGPGYAIVQGDTMTGQGKYIVVSYSAVDTILAIGQAAGSIKYHLVVAEVIDRQALNITTGQSQWQFRVIEDKTGGYSSPAAALTALLPQNALPLAIVRRQVGILPVSQTDITDFRPLCVAVGAQPNMIAGATFKPGVGVPLASGVSNVEFLSNMYLSVPMVIGRTYLVEAQVTIQLNAGAGGNTPIISIKENGTSGASVASINPPVLTSSVAMLGGSSAALFLRGPYFCISTGTKLFAVTGHTNYAGGTWSTMNFLRGDGSSGIATTYMAAYDAGISAPSSMWVNS